MADWAYKHEIVVRKGSVGKNKQPVPIWDAIRDCDGERCELVHRCPYYDPEKGRPMKKCWIEMRYIDTVLDTFLEIDSKREEGMEALDLQKIGLHVIPLYQQLVRMKMKAHAIRRGEDVVGTGASMKTHPVYKEIRSIIKDIDASLDRLGLGGKRTPSGGGLGLDDTDYENGDPDYHERLMRG